ncbi:hypothetical protein M422DRAFT_266931 [Sphaerobolus stellatus SS14]|uniref:Uncharacterized protein n=1 Tax=Sphaerobolus stellatus (strain SS14) TaxID=990650 RepID=A0A0C9UA34_SPHS4|nr:hypothetical protein M422DRAFT_266931 [Sphaerobolus stellatus SS14]
MLDAHDPSRRVCPDFTSEEFANDRRDLTSAECTNAAAAKLLERVWKVNHRSDVAKWQQHREDESIKVVEAMRLQAEQQAESRKAAETEAEETQILAPYAQRKLDKGSYVEMWYFTDEGIVEVTKTASQAEDESMHPIIDPITKVTAWVPAAVKRAPGSMFKDDEELTMEQISIASPRMLLAMEAAAWPEERVNMMVNIWGKLLSHKKRSSANALDVKSLIVYQAEQHRKWHLAIATPRGAWNIGIISEEVLKGVSDEVYQKDREKKDKELRAKVSLFKPIPSTSPVLLSCSSYLQLKRADSSLKKKAPEPRIPH